MTIVTGAAIYLIALYAITMLVVWYTMARHRIERLSSEEVPFVLQEGQTILGVIDTKKTLYFCVARDQKARPPL